MKMIRLTLHFFNKLINFTLRTILHSVMPDKYSSPSDPNNNASPVLYLGPLSSTIDALIIRSSSWTQTHSRIFSWVGPLKNYTGTSWSASWSQIHSWIISWVGPIKNSPGTSWSVSWSQIHSQITSWQGPLKYSTGIIWLSKQCAFLWSNKLSWA